MTAFINYKILNGDWNRRQQIKVLISYQFYLGHSFCNDEARPKFVKHQCKIKRKK